MSSVNSNQSFLMTHRIQVSPPGSNMKVNALAFFDTGSQLSFIRSSLADSLGAPRVGDKLLEVYSFDSQTPTKINSGEYIIELGEAKGPKVKLPVFSTENIGAEIIAVSAEKSDLDRKTPIRATECEPGILVGLRDFWKIFRSKREISPGSYVVNTTLGDILCGRWQIDSWNKPSSQLRASVNAISSIDGVNPSRNEVQEFWALETIGIRDDPQENEDQAAVDAFNKSICRIEGRYSVRWPWKDQNPDLPSNYNMAYHRLRTALQKLQLNPELAEKYDGIIKEQAENGIVELTERRPGELEHYLPHHPVITHKFRIVYDASAHLKGSKSLNQCLFRGHVILPELVGL
jgi:hypothetical protein